MSDVTSGVLKEKGLLYQSHQGLHCCPVAMTIGGQPHTPGAAAPLDVRVEGRQGLGPIETHAVREVSLPPLKWGAIYNGRRQHVG